MPVIQTQTLQQVREAVGRNLNAIRTGRTSDASSTDLETTEHLLYDSANLPGGDNEYRGHWLLIRSTDSDSAWDGSSGGQNVRRVISSSDGILQIGSTLTTDRLPYSTEILVDQEYELWMEEYSPLQINNFINQALHYATGKAYDPEEDISLHLHPGVRRYDIPAAFAAISKLEYRKSVKGEQLSPVDAVWGEIAAPAGVTRVVDDDDYREGSGAMKITATAAVGAGTNLAALAITSNDISEFDTVEFWIKCSIATAAGDLDFRLDDTAAIASPIETINIPALAADTWTFVRLTLVARESDTAIISIGLRYVTDIGAATIWIDDVRVVDSDSAKWEKLDNHLWQIDKSATDIILKPGWRVPYALLKITGGDEPLLPVDDGSTIEIDPYYVIAFATHLALMSTVTRTAVDAAARNILATFWRQEADRRVRAFPPLVDYRQVT